MESVVCLTCLNIASTGPHHMVNTRRNRCVGEGWCNAVGGFGGGADFVFEVLGKVGFLLVGFEVDGDLKFGSVRVEIEDGEDAVSVSVS